MPSRISALILFVIDAACPLEREKGIEGIGKSRHHDDSSIFVASILTAKISEAGWWLSSRSEAENRAPQVGRNAMPVPLDLAGRKVEFGNPLTRTAPEH